MQEENNKEGLLWRSPKIQLGLDMMLFTMMIPLGISLVVKSSDSVTVKVVFSGFFIAWLIKLVVFFYFLAKNIFHCPYWLASFVVVGPILGYLIVDYVGGLVAGLYMILCPIASYVYSSYLYSKHKDDIVNAMTDWRG